MCVCVYMYIKDLSNFYLNINVTLHIIQLVFFLSKIQEHPGNVLFIAVPLKRSTFISVLRFSLKYFYSTFFWNYIPASMYFLIFENDINHLES